jgi:hypothetical protein
MVHDRRPFTQLAGRAGFNLARAAAPPNVLVGQAAARFRTTSRRGEAMC